jgi:hypothetical protein
MTPKETRIYLESISKAKHLNADQRMLCNMFVSCVEYMESGGNRSGLDDLLETYKVTMPPDFIKAEKQTTEVDQLRKERDEARRMFCKTLCKFIGDTPGLAETFANDQGWDCYKEAK